MEGVAVHQRQQWRAGVGEVAGAGLQVGHVAVHRRVHAGAFQVQFRLDVGGFGELHVGLGQAEVGLFAQQLGLGHGDVGAGFLPFLVGDRRARLQRAAADFLALPLAQGGLVGDDRRLRLAEGGLRHLHGLLGVAGGQLVANRVDFQQQVALLHQLVVVHA
ncbi:hypothetical protein D9M68_383650 [compost metagenome]